MQVVKPIEEKIHEYLFKAEQKQMPDFLRFATKYQLEKFDLTGLVDASEPVKIPYPKLDLPVNEWLEREANEHYKPYLGFANSILDLEIYLQDLPPASSYRGWSKWDGKEWKAIPHPNKKVLVFDFEAHKQKNSAKYLPFMCAAIDLEGNWYSWLAHDFEHLPKVVTFGDIFEFGVGHNVVSYDRRYIKESYEFQTKTRYLDTFSLYFLVMGMPSEQDKLWRGLEVKEGNKPNWFYQTCPGRLDKLAKHLLGADMSKQMRTNMQKFNPQELWEYVGDIWEYCARDTLYTVQVYQKLYPQYQEMCPHIIPFAGMIERSTLRVGVTPDYEERIAKVDLAIKDVKSRNQKLLELCFEQSKNYAPLQRAFEKWQRYDFVKRIEKSKGFEKFISQDITEVIKEYRVALKNYLDIKAIRKKGECEPNIVREVHERLKNKIEAVVNHYLCSNKTTMKPKTYKAFYKSLYKKADIEKLPTTPETYISLGGKIAPLLLQIHWKGLPLEYNGSTWGVYKEKEFIPLPHPKGEENVGTPLAKDFKDKVAVGDFTSPLLEKEVGKNGLLQVYEKISEISVWNSFRERFHGIHVYNNLWLTDAVPVGTVTERMIGLAVVMPNLKETRAGTECKHWFISQLENHIYVRADYSSQESTIFAAHDDATVGYLGASALSCQVLTGNSELGTDAHTTTAKLLVSLLPDKIKEQLEKTICKPGQTLAKGLRQLAKSMNFANQFLCGVNKLALMAFIALRGLLAFERCKSISEGVIRNTRGILTYSKQGGNKYEGGMASRAYNRLKALTRVPIQKSTIFKSDISKPLQARYCGKDFMTTRFNNGIQRTGQELVNINLVTCRILATEYQIPYQPSYLVHDELQLETYKQHAKDCAWLMQIGHLFSKAWMYKALEINTMPQNGAYFETVEIDDRLRKTVKDTGVSPSNTIVSPPGSSIKADECIPENIDESKLIWL